ncbi:MAG: hypothetical protein WC641_08500 [Patescibacteria group bacterium]
MFEHNPVQESLPSAEISAEKIRREFQEKPSSEVELLANNLARPDGFAKSLIIGKLMTSRALADAIAPEFVRTNRGYYKAYPRVLHDSHDKNEYISFKVGKTQLMYAGTSGITAQNDEAWKGGLGYAFPAKRLLEDERSRVSWGSLHSVDSLEAIQDTSSMEPIFKPLLAKSIKDLDAEEHKPPKKDFLTRVQLARKAGRLTTGDQAEVNLERTADALPEIDLRETVVLIPARSKAALLRLLRLKLKEMAKWQAKIKSAYQIDVANLTPEEVLARLPTIYWYPQDNIELAVEYLSTHKKELGKILGQKKDD